jgi:predicted dehydrogenase
MSLLRIGLVGCGGRGTGAAENCLRSAPGVKLVALADVFPDKVEKTLQTLRETEHIDLDVEPDRCFTGLDAYRKLCDLPEVDLVLLCTPPGFRPVHFEYAVQAGKHVFMEKPVAVDPAGVRRVIAAGEAAKAKGLGVVAGTQYRHQKSFIEIIGRIHAGEIGDILSACCHYNTTGAGSRMARTPDMSDMEFQLRNWYFFDWLSGDHIVEQHVHTIDAVDWALGARPVRAVGTGGRQVRNDPVKDGNIYDHFAVDLEYPGAVHVLCTCRQIPGCDGYVGARVVGTKGVAWIYEGEIRSLRDEKVLWKASKFDIGSAYVREHTDLIESIRGGKPLNEARQIAESTMTAILARQAAYTGRKLTWEDLMESPLDLSPAKYEFGPLPVRPVPLPGKTT